MRDYNSQLRNLCKQAIPRPTDQEFRQLWDWLSQGTLDELIACGVRGLNTCLFELNYQQGFTLSRRFLSLRALQEIQQMDSHLFDIFERWIVTL